MKDLLAYMIGPKAENIEIFRSMILEALDDHMFWRRNFYPEDRPAVSASDKSREDYRGFVDRLRDLMFEFLSDAKKGVPFFSARYIGHMQTDLLLPALVGYFGAMLYNQNNVAGESSPVTVRLENEVVGMLLRMIGMDAELGYGYLCSGGTAANIYSLWAARNLRTYPVAVRMALERGGGGEAKRAAEGIELGTAKGERRPLLSMSARELMNVPVDELCGLRGRLVRAVRKGLSCDEREAGRLADEFAGPFTFKRLGDCGFRAAASALFPDEGGLFSAPWRVYVPANGHYSWEKSADVLGLGHDSVVKVPHLPGFDVDVGALEKALLTDLDDGRAWPLMVVSNFGTTEEGALDDLPGVRSLLERLQREHGATAWWHVDAAYGGYLAAMIHRKLGDDEAVGAGALKHWLARCCEAAGLEDAAESRDLIEMSESGGGAWLSWRELADRTVEMRRADSVTIDPHKLGYIPYPAGAVLLRHRAAREAISSDAPYLWSDGKDPEEFVGRFTLEGSRPGAAAAACWLAHSSIPLDQSGHGRLVALSILATRRLYGALRDRLQGRVVLLHQPHTNMICYVPRRPGAREGLTERVIERLKPTNEVRPFMAVSTDVELPAGSEALDALGLRAEGARLRVIRSVVMGPYALNAQTKRARGSPRHVFDEYAEHLARVIEEAAG